MLIKIEFKIKIQSTQNTMSDDSEELSFDVSEENDSDELSEENSEETDNSSDDSEESEEPVLKGNYNKNVLNNFLQNMKVSIPYIPPNNLDEFPQFPTGNSDSTVVQPTTIQPTIVPAPQTPEVIQPKELEVIPEVKIPSSKKTPKRENNQLNFTRKDLQSLKLDELKEYCRTKGIKGFSNKKKDDLIDLILQAGLSGKIIFTYDGVSTTILPENFTPEVTQNLNFGQTVVIPKKIDLQLQNPEDSKVVGEYKTNLINKIASNNPNMPPQMVNNVAAMSANIDFLGVKYPNDLQNLTQTVVGKL